MAFLAIAPIFFTSCDDDTAAIGAVIMPEQDNVITSQETFSVTSRTILSDSVLANTNDSYLGCVIDPETRSRTTCNFLAQYHVLENTLFPKKETIVHDANGQIAIDSCDIRIFIDSYYGDSLTTMKMKVQELDKEKIIQENISYYTNLDPQQFITEGKGVKTAVSYAVKDLTRPDSYTDGSTYYRSIIVRLPAEYGRYLMDKYYENPDFYKNSYMFIRNVCPGFYFNISGGVGSMLAAQSSTLNVYFKYHTKNSAGRDTIASAMQRMAATEEVIQQTMIKNEMPEEMLSPANEYTYIKSPAGLFTELTLPVSEIVAGEHYNDTINAASITLQRHNNATQNPYNLPSPGEIIMLRKANVYNFFEKNQLPNNADSYISTFDGTYNSYAFKNISRLITILKNERDKGAGVLNTDDEAARNAKYAEWEAANPDWNKICLVPVNAKYTTTTNSYTGAITKTLLTVKNELGMKSVKLKGGQAGHINIDVVYSKFTK